MTTDKPIIFCDVDGVVADLHQEWVRRYNKEFGDTLALEQITNWAISTFVKPECGEEIFKYLLQQDLYDNVPVITGAREGIGALRENGFRIVFATSSNAKMMGLKLEWLYRHGFLNRPSRVGFPEPDYIEISSKYLLRGAALIDDHGGNLQHFEGERFLFDQHHNQQVDNSSFSRIHGWKDVDVVMDQIYSNIPQKI